MAVAGLLEITHAGPEDATSTELPGSIEKHLELLSSLGHHGFELELGRRYSVHEVGPDDRGQEHVVPGIAISSCVSLDRGVLEEQQDEVDRIFEVDSGWWLSHQEASCRSLYEARRK